MVHRLSFQLDNLKKIYMLGGQLLSAIASRLAPVAAKVGEKRRLSSPRFYAAGRG